MTSQLSQLVKLSPELRREAVGRLRCQAGVGPAPSAPGSAAPLIRRAVRDREPPSASYFQEQLLFLHLLHPESAAYNIPLRARISGPLDVGKFGATIDRVTTRHEALRTHLELVDGRTVQSITPAGGTEVAVTDLSSLPEPERAEALEQAVAAAVHEPFAVRRGPLVRVHLVRLSEAEHELIWVAHHAVADGQSLHALVREIAATYRAVSTGSGPIPPLPVQYADLAVHQREQLTDDRMQAMIEHWRPLLAGAPDFDPPTDLPRPAVQDFAGAMLAFEVPDPVADRLHNAGRELGATLFMVLFAAYRVLLAGWTGQHDLTVGTSVAGRGSTDTDQLIGPLLNVVPTRVAVGPGATFRALVEQVRDSVSDALDYQELPLGQLVRGLAPPRDPGRNPLYQTMFDVNECGPGPQALADDLALTQVPIALEVSQMDVAVVMANELDTLTGRFEYRTALFREETISSLSEAFVRILAAVGEDPDARLDDLVRDVPTPAGVPR
ncbi:condensation domain protein [Kribbella flavida DSM 17836]|uniref:Condensation domain protein n=1 Tax=Kribbella flavida (strain DSM 17836 / JCM 10339 / NBRC 14399) TaxID=479435 RepID=D2PSP5_KRIFD|nr:condensation domain-containing protein [Kribbella flavida]ADB33183.1 condensation domain protein [Kribbella flavida DSM 17836]